jgi:hypothetical protein
VDVPGRIPRERGARERFARAVDEGATHLDDQEFADELAVISALRRAGSGVEPGERARARIATRIAEADREPEPVPEPVAVVAVAEEPPTRIPHPRSPEPEPSRSKPRLTTVLAAAFCLVLALAGLGSVLSTDSLPGDLLYQVKRVQESAILHLTLDDEDRARQRLEYAGDRLVELARLAERAEPGTSEHGFRVALADFGSDTRVAVAQLTTLATTSDGSQFDLLRDWVATQSGRLDDLRTALPAELAEDRARTVRLLRDIDARASALSERMNCYQITSGQSDELGVLPSEQPCRPLPGNGTAAPAAPEPTPDGRDGTGADDRTDSAQPDARLTAQPTDPSDAPVTSMKPPSTNVPVTSGYEPRQRLPVPPAASVSRSRSRIPTSAPEPPAEPSVPPVLPDLPGPGVG